MSESTPHHYRRTRTVYDLLAIGAGMFFASGLFSNARVIPLNVLSWTGLAAAVCAGSNYSRNVRIAGRYFSFLAAGTHLYIQARVMQVNMYAEVASCLAILSIPVLILILWASIDWLTSQHAQPHATSSIWRGLFRLKSGIFLVATIIIFLFSIIYLLKYEYTTSEYVALILNAACYASFAVAGAILFWLLTIGDLLAGVDLKLATLNCKAMGCAVVFKITSIGTYGLTDATLAMTALATIGVCVVVRSEFLRVTENKPAPIAA